MKLFVLCCVLLFLTGSAQAQKTTAPIVYSARYYTPPASKRPSAYHLYCINPDGTGKRELTSTALDDVAPRWSPDGKHIAFLRTSSDDSFQDVCVIDADGGGFRRLYHVATGDVSSSPEWEKDGETLHLTDNTGQYRMISARSGGLLRTIPASPADSSLPTIASADATGVVLSTPAGTRYTFDKDVAKLVADEEVYPQAIEVYGRIPGKDRRLLLRHIAGNSTNGHWYLYFVANDRTKQLSLFIELGNLHFAPEGKRFVATRGRDLAPYGKRSDGKERTVWVAPLLIGNITSGGAATVRDLVNGLVSVVGCDWRQ